MAQNDNDKKLDPSQIDQDAGDMNNGTLGGDLGINETGNAKPSAESGSSAGNEKSETNPEDGGSTDE